MSMPNEWWMLRRAARHVVIQLWRNHELWQRPESLLEAYEAVKIIRNAADQIQDGPPKKRRGWFCH